MSAILITYDLRKEKSSDGYKKVLDVIHAYNSVQLSESTYAIETWETPEMVNQRFSGLIDENDNLLVFSLKQPCAGWHRTNIIEWLNTNLDR
jgi:hypothetical protein